MTSRIRQRWVPVLGAFISDADIDVGDPFTAGPGRSWRASTLMAASRAARNANSLTPVALRRYARSPAEIARSIGVSSVGLPNSVSVVIGASPLDGTAVQPRAATRRPGRRGRVGMRDLGRGRRQRRAANDDEFVADAQRRAKRALPDRLGGLAGEHRERPVA